MTMTRVGFIGLGIMGGPMAGHLLDAGYPLSLYNRTADKARTLGDRGATLCSSPSQAAAASEVIITMVSDTPDVEEVVAGKEGILEGIPTGGVVIDMSTVSPRLERELDERLRAKGCSLVDAPVSGGDIGARNRTLAIMAGGEAGEVERVRPILEVMGRVTYCGPVGCGQLTKLCNQILVAGNLLAASESVTFARKNGLDPGVMIEAVKDGAAGSWQMTHLGPKIVEGDFSPGFKVDLMQKDLRLVMEAATAGQVTLPATALIHQLLCSAQAHGEGQLGTQVLARVLARLSGVETETTDH